MLALLSSQEYRCLMPAQLDAGLPQARDLDVNHPLLRYPYLMTHLKRSEQCPGGLLQGTSTQGHTW